MWGSPAEVFWGIEETQFGEAMEFSPFSERGKAFEVRDRCKEAQQLEMAYKAYAERFEREPDAALEGACGSSWNGSCEAALYRSKLLEDCRSLQ